MSGLQYDVVVVGGGPSGATAARELARDGLKVMLIDKEGRIKPCGGAIPSRLVRDHDIPSHLIKARIHAARIVSPKGQQVDMEIGDIGYVGMVDREEFDPFLRERAEADGADRLAGSFKSLTQNDDGSVSVAVTPKGMESDETLTLTCRVLIGADGANSRVRHAVFGPDKTPPYVFAYHEIVESPEGFDRNKFDPERCDVIYDGVISPDFYGWVFPHGSQTSIGTGSAHKGHSLRTATTKLREQAGLLRAKTVRTEGAPLPLKPMKKWDNNRNVVLTGDAAGVVAPSSGEGIFYAMLSGELAAKAAAECVRTGDRRALAMPRKAFMKDHGRVFMVLGFMQAFWYKNDKRREKFVTMCRDPDVQRLTWESYLNKKLVRRDPMAHIRVFFKDMREIIGLGAR